MRKLWNFVRVNEAESATVWGIATGAWIYAILDEPDPWVGFALIIVFNVAMWKCIRRVMLERQLAGDRARTRG